MGIPIGTIQGILGHQNRKTTEIYLHSVGDAERKTMDRLQEVDAFTKVESALVGSPVNMGSTFCNRKVDRPPFDVFKDEINKLGYSAVGRKYGVSDNAIRKWLKVYEQKQSNMKNVRTKKVTHRVTHKNKKGPALSS